MWYCILWPKSLFEMVQIWSHLAQKIFSWIPQISSNWKPTGSIRRLSRVKTLPITFLILLFIAVSGMGHAEDEITISARMNQIAPSVRDRVKPWFIRSRLDYPPKKLALVAIKDEKRLKVYSTDDDGDWRFVMQYQIAKLSGKPGPKLRSGDKQVPEGSYKVVSLNPASRFWLSLGLNYPNAFDRKQARNDGRKKLGGDIMLHGYWFSTGCVAMGNTATEDLFVLAKDTGIDSVEVIISPTDFRNASADEKKLPTKPVWVKDLYGDLKEELNALGTDGLSTDSKLIAYNDLAPPPPPKPTTVFGKILRALSEAAETSGTKSDKTD